MSNRLTSAIMVLEARFFLSKYYNKGGLRVLLVIDINKSSGIILGGNKVLREVTGETTAAEVWSKLKTLYLTNKLYLKKKLYTFYMPAGRDISKHIDEFNKIIFETVAKG
ncbi:hypothetical protein Tco_0942765 [Tanacetum coccineum]